MMSIAGEDDAAVNAVSPLVRKAAAWSWRLLVIGAALGAVVWVVSQLSMLVISVSIALIFTALLLTPVDWLHRHGVPRGGAVALVLLGGLALLGGLMTFVVRQFIAGLPELSGEVTRSIESARNWLTDGPLGLSGEQIENAGNSAIEAIRNNQEQLTTGAITTATTVTQLVTGLFLVLFAVIFLLHGGRNIWQFVTKLVPSNARERVRTAGAKGFGSLVGFVRATFFVALVDAVGIGAGLALMGIPLALPLASLVFLGAFIPVVGAVVTGFLAVIVALLSKGFVFALLTLGLVLAVQQLEGNVLQPLVMGRAVKIHPLAVLLAITAGAILAGIVGALLAIPLVAFANTAVRHLLSGDEPDPAADGPPGEPDEEPETSEPVAQPAGGGRDDGDDSAVGPGA